MYQLNFNQFFLKQSNKLTKKNPDLKIQMGKTFAILRQDPFYPSLKTHKAIHKSGIQAFTSWVNQDIRVIWRFDKDEVKILHLLDIGGHSGSSKIYK